MITEDRVRELVRMEIRDNLIPALASVLAQHVVRISALEHLTSSLHQTSAQARTALVATHASIDASHALLRQQAARGLRSDVRYLTLLK